jgi:hypothetical protein
MLGVALLIALAQEPVPTFGTTVVVNSGLKGLVYHIRRNSEHLPNFEKPQTERHNLHDIAQTFRRAIDPERQSPIFSPFAAASKASIPLEYLCPSFSLCAFRLRRTSSTCIRPGFPFTTCRQHPVSRKSRAVSYYRSICWLRAASLFRER